MNGRELVADDVVFNFSRNLGLGEFAADGPSPVISVLGSVPIESITTTDRYTVVFKLKQPRLSALYHIIGDIYGNQYPPEVIRQYGDAKDWTKLVGTGPFMWTDWVKGTSLTYTKNPDYWGNDEKFPENRLPYVDEVKLADHAGRGDAPGGAALGPGGCAGWALSRSRSRPAPRPRAWSEPIPELKQFAYQNRGNNSAAFNITRAALRRRSGAQGDADGPGPRDGGRRRTSRAMQMPLLGASSALPTSGTRSRSQSGPTRSGVTTATTRKVQSGFSMKLDIRAEPTASDSRPYPTPTPAQRQPTKGFAAIRIQFWDAIGVDVELEIVEQAEFGPMTAGRVTVRRDALVPYRL